MSLPVAILAGGLATRLRPISDQVPKALVEVAGRPFAEHQIELLHRHDVKDVVYLVGHLGEMVREALGDGGRWGMRIQYSFDGAMRLGTGGAVRRALPILGSAFFVLYGDSYLECNYQAIERMFAECGKAGLMAVFRNDGEWDRSNVRFEQGQIVRYDKQNLTPAMRHIDYGLGVFNARAFTNPPGGAPFDSAQGKKAPPYISHEAGEAFDLADVYQTLLANDDLAGYEVGTRFYEIGSPAGLEETRAYLATKLKGTA